MIRSEAALHVDPVVNLAMQLEHDGFRRLLVAKVTCPKVPDSRIFLGIGYVPSITHMPYA